MGLSQEEKDKLYELIDKLNPCVAIASKEVIERFKEWTEGKVKAFEIPDNDNFLDELDRKISSMDKCEPEDSCVR